MNRIVVKNEKLNEEYYCYEHETGLKILLYPMSGYSSAYALFGTNFGSVDVAFKTNQEAEYTEVPEGVAHFLEHKLFESEEGDAFSMFAKTGASANAYTSFDKTCYLFSTTQNFEESLKSLVKFVQEPYFTQATVEKEQGIIGQEIRMYDDDPEWRVLFNLLGALYVNHPVRIDIAGTVESIAKIDADLLYQCYRTFYNLNNMALAVAGNFDVDAAVKIIEEGLKPGEKVTVAYKTPEEPQQIRTEYTEQALSVSIPLFNIGFKEPVREGLELLKAQVVTELLMEVIAGESSPFYRRLYEQSLINQNFGFEVFCGRGYFANLFAGESTDPKRVFAELKAEILQYQQSGISAEDFDRCRKMMYGKLVRSFNKVEVVANAMINCHFAGVGIYDTQKILEEITLEDANALLKTSFCMERAAISVIQPVA